MANKEYFSMNTEIFQVHNGENTNIIRCICE